MRRTAATPESSRHWTGARSVLSLKADDPSARRRASGSAHRRQGRTIARTSHLSAAMALSEKGDQGRRLQQKGRSAQISSQKPAVDRQGRARPREIP